jgi:hypothetical protein
VIRPDITAALDAFWRLTRGICVANDALLDLLLKSSEAQTIRGYRPISLIRMVGKLIPKILVNRLALKLTSLVLGSQRAFMKGRSIHHNFRYVQASARQLEEALHFI